MVMAAEELLNDLLDDDIIDKGYGIPDYLSIISTEASGSQIERLANILDEPGRTLVMVSAVSAKDNVRDHIRQIARGYLYQGVELSELEYQPA
ncbi:hypothetical protein N7478_012322 [Penicillium angulare]|uniref:uncharacterized protein n=1 Tax=Penicillium angulare TaxID=116970 RepID=UPI0025425545|nr:uncharacterized protein N7478_012322 [Penicillium angulare]KAJ5259341.1 hypothetical protein N7478_012322 [Penicillium angulare]